MRISKDFPLLAFRSLILEISAPNRRAVNHEDLSGYKIFSVPRRALNNNIGNHPTQRKVDSSLRAIICCAFLGDGLPAIHSAQLVRLLLEARLTYSR